MNFLILSALICLLGDTLTEAKKPSRSKSKNNLKRNIDYSNTGYNSVPAQEQAVAASGYAQLSLRQNIAGPPPQLPPVLDALDILRGRPPLTAKEANDVIAYSTGGKDYPAYLEIPKTYFTCGSAKPGLYADLDHYCQVYHRCDISGKQSTYICPPKTLFNQITLVCDWFYNINCPNSRQFVEYSNSRLYYPQWQILDTQLDYVQPYVQPQPRSEQQSYGPSQSYGPPSSLQQAPQPPPVLYPGKPSPQVYNSPSLNGHENPDYQMSVIIRNPQMIPDYSIGESQLVPSKEQMDQGSTAAPPQVSINVGGGNGQQDQSSETIVIDTPQRPNGGGSVNVTINLEPTQGNVGQNMQQDAGKNVPIMNQRFPS